MTARLRHEVSNDLTLTSDTKYGVYTRYFQQTVPNACTDTLTSAATGVTRCYTYLTDNDPTTVPQVGIGGPGPYDQTTTGVQNVSTLSYTAPIGGPAQRAARGLGRVLAEQRPRPVQLRHHAARPRTC